MTATVRDLRVRDPDHIPKRFQKPVLDGREASDLLKMPQQSFHKAVRRGDLPCGGSKSHLHDMRIKLEDCVEYMRKRAGMEQTATVQSGAGDLVPVDTGELINATQACELLNRSTTWFSNRVKDGLLPMLVSGDVALYARADVLALKELDDERDRARFRMVESANLGADATPVNVIGQAVPAGQAAPPLLLETVEALRKENAQLQERLSALLRHETPTGKKGELTELLLLAKVAAEEEHVTEIHMVRQPTGKWQLRTERVVVTSTSEEF